MSKLEKEVKILDIDVKKSITKLKKMNAKYKGIKNQKIYTYDSPTIYYRYLETIELLKSDNKLLLNTSIRKLGLILDEYGDLEDIKVLSKIYKEMNINNFDDLYILEPKEILSTINKSKLFKNSISKYMINPNKWVRLRESNDKIELTVKHIYNKNNSFIQKVKEYEINTSSLEETNNILEAIGFVKRNYQEKIRHSFIYKEAEIELDEWPMIKPYMEIECDNEELIKEIIDRLEYNDKEIVSLNTEQLYKREGIDVLKMSELKF